VKLRLTYVRINEEEQETLQTNWGIYRVHHVRHVAHSCTISSELRLRATADGLPTALRVYTSMRLQHRVFDRRKTKHKQGGGAWEHVDWI